MAINDQPITVTFSNPILPGQITVLPNNQAGITYVDGSIMYVCRAPIGTASTAAAWQIKKVDLTTDIIIKWCDGDDLYDNVATSLAVVEALTYL